MAPARAQCPGTSPLYQEVVNADPQILNTCIGVPVPCPKPSAPTVVADSFCSILTTKACTSDADCDPGEGTCEPQFPIFAQEEVLSAWIPAGYTAKSARVHVDSDHPVQGFSTLYEATFVEGFGAGLTGPREVRLGVTGVVPEAAHYYRVSFCNDSGCLCWSDRLLASATPAFSDLAPDPPPSPMKQQVEDNFSRPVTTGKLGSGMPFDPNQRLGDGLGPDAVWLDYNPLAPVGNGSHIHSDEDSAFIPVNASICRVAPATHQHSYVEALLSLAPDRPDDTYNIDVRSRAHTVGGTLRGYSVKLAYGHHGATSNPQLVVVRGHTLIQNVPGCTLNLPTNACSGPGTSTCDCAPPIADGAVWVRNEVKDGGDPVSPHITGTAAWDCEPGDSIEQCGRVCQIACVDDDLKGRDLLDIKGQQGIQAHERDILLLVFRAGSHSCGDGICDPNESCASCAADCGICP